MLSHHVPVSLFFAIILGLSFHVEAQFSAGTTIQAAGINNLRNSINTKLSTCSVATYLFSDHPASSSTPIKANHLIELRNAISFLHTSQGFAAPTYTDPVIIPGITPVKAIHFSELQTLTASASCATPCPATLASWTISGNTCNASLTSIAANSTLGVSDSAGPTTGSATFRCNAVGAWVSTTSPEAAPAPSCSTANCPATLASWTIGVNTCSENLPATPASNTVNITDLVGPATGSATFRCDAAGNWASTTIPEAAPAPSCGDTTIACSSIVPNPMSKPGGWGTPAMPFNGYIDGSFTAGTTGTHNLNVISNHLRLDLGVCTSVGVVVLDGASIVASDAYPKPAWPGFTANCVNNGGSGYNNMTSTISFSATAGVTYTIRFYYKKVTPGVDKNAWSWTDCN